MMVEDLVVVAEVEAEVEDLVAEEGEASPEESTLYHETPEWVCLVVPVGLVVDKRGYNSTIQALEESTRIYS